MSGAFTNCCCGDCIDDGCFIYATTTAKGWLGPEYYEPPEFAEQLYRTATFTHTFDWYYLDPESETNEAIFWKTVTKEYTYKIHPFHNVVYYKKIAGSEQGTIYEATWNFTTCEWDVAVDLDPEDYVMEQSPYWGPPPGFNDPNQGWVALDLPETPDVCPLEAAVVGGASPLVTAVGEGTISVDRISADLGHIAAGSEHISHAAVVIVMSDPFDPTTIAAEAAEMLLTVPLQVPNQLVPTASPEYFGFESTQQSPYGGNVLLITKNMGVCKTELVYEFGTIVGQSEHSCCVSGTCYDEFSGYPAITCTDNGDTRIQSYTPAARTGEKILVGGTDDGTLYTVTQIYGSDSCEIDISTAITAEGFAKKSLLSRILPDSWTGFMPYDATTETYTEAGAELLACDTTECFRYYYPDGADTKVEDALCKCVVFHFSGDGIIYRALPIDICAEDPCPTGLMPPAFAELECP